MRLLPASCCLFALSAGAAEPRTRRIEKEVRHELAMLPFYSVFDDLSFRTDGEEVHLLDDVTRPSLKADAERSVKRVEGVKVVENKLEVLPLAPKDDRIRLAAYRAIYGRAESLQLAGGPDHSHPGSERTRHVARTSRERGGQEHGGIQANTIDGVSSVTNELSVDQAR